MKSPRKVKMKEEEEVGRGEGGGAKDKTSWHSNLY